MPDRRRKTSKQRGLENYCERYVAYWMFVCLAAVIFLGWPAIVSWAGLAWGMHVFLKIFFGGQDSGRSKRKQ